jgi:hypothetical protein
MKEIESITNLPIKKTQDPDNFIDILYQTFRVKMIPVLYNL